MKKLMLTVFGILFAAIVMAQSSVQFGLRGGLNLATLNGENMDPDHRTGFHAGALAHIHLSERFALQPEVYYSMQGAEYDNNRKDKLNYINVPLMGQMMFGKGWRLQTGPQIGFMTKALNENNGNKTELTDNYKKTDLSWSFGAGYLTRSGLGFDARYNLGLNDISKNDSGLKNRVWQVGLFYQFGS